MNLAIDIGNTRTKIGLFRANRLVHTQIWDRITVDKLKSIATNHALQNCIFSSTAHLHIDIPEVLQELSRTISLEASTPVPIDNQYATPHTLGKDRLAAVVGAHAFYPHNNCLIIDAGTCITYEFLTASGVYLGGNIAPGLRMRARAMHEFTAKLPLVSIDEPTDSPIGNSTHAALHNGVVWGAQLEIMGTIDYCTQHLGTTRVILTGGDATLLHRQLSHPTVVHPHLVLHGLNKILNYNVEIAQ
ncbi:MAG: type III pantothenate kinase [Bacteroidota bacterium]